MHLTDVQLNEYLDHETNDRAEIEMHLSTCADCAARLNALRNLFDEIESLPDLAFSREFTVRVESNESLPRSLTLTVTLQAALAVAAIFVAAPFVTPLISPYLSSLSAPSFAELFLQMQNEWTTWLDRLLKLQLPTIPEVSVFDLPSLFIMSTVIGVSLLWLIGNGLLLRNQMK